MEGATTQERIRSLRCDPFDCNSLEYPHPNLTSDPFCGRVALVTGANKGIGLETCRQLLSKGATVILTARDEQRGLAAVRNLQASGASDVLFHQLDVADSASVSSLAGFIHDQFGKLDVLVCNIRVYITVVYTVVIGSLTCIKFQLQLWLSTVVNNAAVHGVGLDTQILGPSNEAVSQIMVTGANKGIGLEVCRQLAFNGVKVILTARDETKGMEALEKMRDSELSDIIFHQLDVTDASSIASLADFIRTQFGKLDILHSNCSALYYSVQVISNERLQEELSDVDCLTEERLDQLSTLFLKDFKDGLLGANGWPTMASAYKVSKVLTNAYTRILAKTHPALCINCVNPGFVKTDLNWNSGILTVEEGAKGPVLLALGYHGRATGFFFDQTEASSF
ncbi:hypothetical protein B296_00008114 [Ensete ventricosum]|uniref:Uncharacterized protein n=1 Tax=Ensete ventricosum TaxID=4639 RepID=A0A427AMY2_ENSVE|nr:hypothetical protein B296_00008114 [Ensete ventricosum]